MKTTQRRVVVLVDDIMVRSRIESAADATINLSYPASEQQFQTALQQGADLILVGMAATRKPWADWIRLARAADPTRHTPIIAFGPHRDLALRRLALEAGASRVLANSALMQNLPGLLSKTTAANLPEDEEEVAPRV